MKKSIFAIVAVICLMFISCGNNKVIADIQKYIGDESITDVSIKELKIDKDYYEYLVEYGWCENELSACKESKDVLKEWLEAFPDDYIESWKKYPQEYNKLTQKRDRAKDKLKFYNHQIDSLSALRYNLINNNKSGILYVMRYKTINKFGTKDKYNSYSVYAYNSVHGHITEYDGDDKMDIVFAKYPKAKEEIANIMANEIGNALESLSEMFN